MGYLGFNRFNLKCEILDGFSNSTYAGTVFTEIEHCDNLCHAVLA